MVDKIIKRFKQGKIRLRTLSAIVLMPIVIYLVYYGGIPYKTSLCILSVAMMWEWVNLTRRGENTILWLLFGIFYIIMPCYLLLLLREMHDGMKVTFWLLSCVWATDIGAYFTGIIIRGPKIMPTISANKTWSGLVGAIVSSGIVGCVYAKFTIFDDYIPYLYMSFIIPIIAQIGDFFESAIKRHFKVKDSGSIIPGHGGLLDRLDGLITSVVFVWVTIQCLGMI